MNNYEVDEVIKLAEKGWVLGASSMRL